MKSYICLTVLLFIFQLSDAQIQWHNPASDSVIVVQGQGWPAELKGHYTRLPEQAKEKVRHAVWDLSRNSAGIAVHFYSNSPTIQIRYQVEGGHAIPHMPATGVSGIDLYAHDANGRELWCAGKYSFGDTIQYLFRDLSYTHPYGYEYRLYLPLYNTVKWLEIGTENNSNFKFIPTRPEKPIVVYGTSIAQGACASRPGMAWTNILERRIDHPFINLGFSGNGKLEKELLTFINGIDARLYILDCMPNLTNINNDTIKKLLINAVKQIRATHPRTPVLITEHDGYTNDLTNKIQYEAYTNTNIASRKAFEQLQQDGIQALYYLSHQEIGMDMDAMVDGVHATDYGMKIYADAYEKIIRQILQEPAGAISTTSAISQRREAPGYEWKERHATILRSNKEIPSRSVIIGNSITHFWGGKPEAQRKNGKATWDEYMEPAGFRNLGCGWDRIENMLWRIYNGELDGYQAERIIIVAGTNNLTDNTDTEIVEGINNLIKAIRVRQSSAEIKVIGILPRRDMEKRIVKLNQEIKKMTEDQGILFEDAGKHLLNAQHLIDEKLFLDGLHPNEAGYRKIVKDIIK